VHACMHVNMYTDHILCVFVVNSEAVDAAVRTLRRMLEASNAHACMYVCMQIIFCMSLCKCAYLEARVRGRY
jgi:hypothetical protein